MARKKRPPEDDNLETKASASRSADRHKARRTVSFPPKLYEQLAKLADKYHRPIQWQAHLLIQEALQAEGLWPPPAS